MRKNDMKYITEKFSTLPERLRQLRLKSSLSRAMLAEKAGVTKKLVEYYEDCARSDERIPTWYLKTIASALGYAPYYLCDDYHIFLDGNYAQEIENWILRKGYTYSQAQAVLGVKECALNGWRSNKTRPPYRVFELIHKNE